MASNTSSTLPPPGIDPSPATPPALPPLDFGAVLGSQFVGTLLNFCLYGVLAVQVYVYRLNFPKDAIKIKILVYFTFLFETTQTILNGIDAFNDYARGYGSTYIFTTVGLGPIYAPIFASVMALIVQSFFCYRIVLIERKAWWISAIIGLVSLAQVIGGLYGGINALVNNTTSVPRIGEILSNIWFVGDAVADILIALAMCFLLLRTRNRMPQRTNDMIAKIVILIVETNTLSALVALVAMVLSIAYHGTSYFLCPTLVLGKLYANTLLLTFNNRAYINTTGPGTIGSTSRRHQLHNTIPFSSHQQYSTDQTVAMDDMSTKYKSFETGLSSTIVSA